MADLGEPSGLQQFAQGFGAGFTGTPLSRIQKSARERQLLQRIQEQRNNPQVLQGPAAKGLAISNPDEFKKIASALNTSDQLGVQASFDAALKIDTLFKRGRFQDVLGVFQKRIQAGQAVGRDMSDTIDTAARYQKALSEGDKDEIGEIAGDFAGMVQLGRAKGILPELRKRELSSVQKKVEAEGIDPFTPAGQKRARELNLGARTDPSLTPTANQVLAKASEQQLAAAGFANRVQSANVGLNTLEDTPGFNPAKLDVAVLEGIRGGNLLIPEEHQQYIQFKSDFITAVLRKESGAVISDTEFEREDRKFFPQPGDKKRVIAQKRKGRVRAFENLEKQSKGVFDIQFGAEVQPLGVTDGLPPGLPEGTVDNGDGTFTLPTGETVAPQ